MRAIMFLDRRVTNEARRRFRDAALDLRFTQGETSHFGNTLSYTGGDNGTYSDINGIIQTSGADESRFEPSGLLI